MKEIYILSGEQLKSATPEQAFPFLQEKNHRISLVGAGGKTSLLYDFASQYAAQGFRTAVTTTTHIYHPSRQKPETGKFRYVPEISELCDCWESGDCAVCGTPTTDGKLKMLPEAELTALETAAECVLIEADGAKCLSCKVPAAHEPVLRPECDVVVGVLGLSALGKTLREGCFRSDEAAKLLGVSVDHRLTEEDFVRILLSENGTKKSVGNRAYYVVLNQCDDEKRKAQGEKILRMLRERGQERAALTKSEKIDRKRNVDDGAKNGIL